MMTPPLPREAKHNKKRPGKGGKDSLMGAAKICKEIEEEAFFSPPLCSFRSSLARIDKRQALTPLQSNGTDSKCVWLAAESRRGSEIREFGLCNAKTRNA